MGANQPPSPATDLSTIRAAGQKLASLCRAEGLLRIAPGLPAAALAGVVILFFAWSCEHRARQREVAQAKQVQKQATEEISRLQQQAAGAVKDAQQSSQAAQETEAQQQQLAREAERLRQSLEILRKEELARTNEVATLTTAQVAERVASRLQEQGIGNREQGTGNQGTGQRGNPLTRPAPAGENAGSGHSLPQGGEGSAPTGKAGQDAGAALVLSDQGARKVESAFVELDSCRRESQVMAQQVSNCEQREKLSSTLEEQQAGTISKLNAALADKDKILAEREAADRAELKAARGTFRSRFFHAVEIFAGGFVAGVLVR